ncbi:type II toxin-antitoxin system RelE/ParE family toxin [Roseibium litorale]|uniref:Toxin n=1 Tax=Roseibium litorale TaxID=2803841 RepID=A0ABR9CJN9_9HYPH|nr:type II toxin-antitoxin system RelE/ParE family toxin [Roseibium litorale]MBD8891046.1 type II toxin-antitoxin system RelE/ParE family toxin [Roseibium litorale]
MTYKLSRKAAEDIANIYIEGVAAFGLAQAEKYHAEMETTFELLADNPQIARHRHEIDPPVRIHPFRSHIVIYLIDEEGDVLIVRVRHGREDWQESPAD